MQWTHEHQEIQKTLKRFIDAEINPHAVKDTTMVSL